VFEKKTSQNSSCIYTRYYFYFGITYTMYPSVKYAPRPFTDLFVEESSERGHFELTLLALKGQVTAEEINEMSKALKHNNALEKAEKPVLEANNDKSSNMRILRMQSKDITPYETFDIFTFNGPQPAANAANAANAPATTSTSTDDNDVDAETNAMSSGGGGTVVGLRMHLPNVQYFKSIMVYGFWDDDFVTGQASINSSLAGLFSATRDQFVVNETKFLNQPNPVRGIATQNIMLGDEETPREETVLFIKAPMPFWQRARFRVVNRENATVTLGWNVEVESPCIYNRQHAAYYRVTTTTVSVGGERGWRLRMKHRFRALECRTHRFVYVNVPMHFGCFCGPAESISRASKESPNHPRHPT
jgi:hypothetical protein